MMYVIYNYDGSIKYKLLNEFVEQGNNNVNELFVAIEGRENWTLYASFKLPNGSTTTVVSSTPATEFIEGLGTFTGRKILLSNAETLVAGALQMNVVCLDENDAKLVAFNTYITVNETGIQLSDPILLTVQEYENLLVELKRKMEYPVKYVQVTELPDNPSLDTIYVLKGEDDLNEVFMYNGKTESWIPLGSNRINLGLYYTKAEGEEFEEGIEQRVSNVESQVQSVASGSPKGVYATLSDLETAYPTGTSGIYVVSADGHWYYWDTNDSAWTDGGVYQATSIGGKVITFNNIGDIVSLVRGTNLFDAEKDEKGYFSTGSIGNIIGKNANANFITYKFRVEYGKTYVVAGTSYYTFLTDKDGIIISRIGDPGTSVSNFSFSVNDANCLYAYISFNKNDYNENTYMIAEGSSLPAEYVKYVEDYFEFIGKQKYTSKDEIVDTITTTNLYNTENAVDNIFYTASVGNEIVEHSNESFCGNIIPVKYGEVYTITRTDYYVYLLDEDYKVLAYTGDYQTQTNVVVNINNSSCKYIAVNVNKNYKGQVMVVKGTTVPATYQKYFEGFYYKLKGKDYYEPIEKNNVFRVGADKQFTTFTACLQALQGNEKEKTIFIDGGEYDIFEELGGSDFALSIPSGTNWRDVNVIVPPNTKIIGLGNVVLKMTPTAQEIGSIASNLLSPLNITYGCHVENITIVGDNCRYCIHDEVAGTPETNGAKHIYKNVKCYKSSSGNLGYRQAFGCGFTQNQVFEFENCHFESRLGAVSFHDSYIPASAGASITFNNCVIKSTSNSATWSLRFGAICLVQREHKVCINNTYLNKDIYLNKEVSNATLNNYNIKMLGSSNVNITLEDGLTNIYTPEIYL